MSYLQCWSLVRVRGSSPREVAWKGPKPSTWGPCVLEHFGPWRMSGLGCLPSNIYFCLFPQSQQEVLLLTLTLSSRVCGCWCCVNTFGPPAVLSQSPSGAVYWQRCCFSAKTFEERVAASSFSSHWVLQSLLRASGEGRGRDVFFEFPFIAQKTGSALTPQTLYPT